MVRKITFAAVLVVLLSMGLMGQQVGPANSVPDIVARFVAVESTAQRAQADYVSRKRSSFRN
jgi:predicted LPLAT superfamily acyltransferase